MVAEPEGTQHHRPHVVRRWYGIARQRIPHFTWAWFSTTMATGSLSAVLHQSPLQFTGLITIGKAVFIVDLVLFCTFCVMMIVRFTLLRKALVESLYHPGEAFYFGTFWVSVSFLLTNISLYGSPYCGPWLVTTLQVCFWFYGGSVLLVAIFQYYMIFMKECLQISGMLPTWILPIYPLLVAGPLAGTLLDYQPTNSAINIWVGGVLFQGLGWIVSIFLYVLWTIRLLCDELPSPAMRPGMYISVGPTAYTSQALILLGSRATKVLPTTFFDVRSAAPDIIKVLGATSGIFIWLLAFWFFGITTIANAQHFSQMSFSLSWWAFVFPNVGFTFATIEVAKILDCEGIKWLACVMIVVLFAAWLFVGFSHVRAVWRREILWPGKDEDKDMES